MAGSVNKVILIGNLGKAADIRQNTDGSKIATLSIATSETWKDKNTGERKEKTDWHRVVIFNEKLAEIVEKYTQKGSKVCVEGQLQNRKWTDQQGIERYTTEVVLQRFRGDITLLDSKSSGPDSSYGDAFGGGGSSSFDTSPLGSSGSYEEPSASLSSSPQRFEQLNDDVPF